MKRLLWVPILGFFLSVLPLAADQPQRVLVELFTSQG